MMEESRTLCLILEKEEAVMYEMKQRLVHLADSSRFSSDVSDLLGVAPPGVFLADFQGDGAQNYIRSKLEFFHRVSLKAFGCFLLCNVFVMFTCSNQIAEGYC